MTIKLLCLNEIISKKETLIKLIEFKLITMNEKHLQCRASSEFTHINWVGQFMLSKMSHSKKVHTLFQPSL